MNYGGAQGGPFILTTQTKMEFDGYINFQIALKHEPDNAALKQKLAEVEALLLAD